MAERLTEAQFSTQCAFIAKNAAAWAGDILTLPERYNEIASPANVGRFTDEMRWRLNRLDAWAGRSAPAKITDHMIEAAKKELFGKGLVDTFTIRAALEAALTAAPTSAAEPVTDRNRLQQALVDAQISLDPARETMWAKFYAADIDAANVAVRSRYEGSLIEPCDCGEGRCIDPADCPTDRLRAIGLANDT